MSAQQPVLVVTTDGTTVKVDRGHRGMSPDAMDAAERYAVQSGTHLWVATAAYRLSPDALDRADTDPLMFDAESLLATAIGCYVCEQPWDAQLTRRRCKGSPS